MKRTKEDNKRIMKKIKRAKKIYSSHEGYAREIKIVESVNLFKGNYNLQ